MRTIYSILLLAFALHIFAQTPQGFNYSAVARDASGKPIANKNIAVQMSILKTSSSGILQYAETHLVNTDAYGLFNLVVGNGSVVTGTLTNIQWGTDKHFLKVSLDLNGGNNFAVMGTTQLMSVPYAMYAVNGLQSGTTTGEILYWNGTNWLPITPGNQSQTLTFCDGKPTWTTAGQCPGTLAALNCGNPTNNGNLISGSPSNGVSSSIFYTGGGGGNHNGQTVSSSGVTGLTATLLPGSLVNGSGTLTYNISGTPSTSGIANFAINIGGQTCALTRTVNSPVGTITSIACASANNSGSLTPGNSANGVVSNIPYAGGNGGTYSSQTINSTGVTGLTASLATGNFANGNGSLVFNITGTPSNSGTANFNFSIGGQVCSFSLAVQSIAAQYPAGSVFCNGKPTAIVDVFSPNTGKTWMDRNLGAVQVATSITDASAYGDLYQWGRGPDGHQCRSASVTSALSSSDQPGNSLFITIGSGEQDWLTNANTNLWQGVSGINNPCPIGYRIPTSSELDGEIAFWNSSNLDVAFNSPLKLTYAGYKLAQDGSRGSVGDTGRYWTSSVSANYNQSTSLQIVHNNGNNYFQIINEARGYGQSIRCIKD
jgi:uncharacterized protein (TIGR02145 family)